MITDLLLSTKRQKVDLGKTPCRQENYFFGVWVRKFKKSVLCILHRNFDS